MRTLKVDVAIAGAGIAGLWVANLLLHRGLQVALCEPREVGGHQTLASQGIIHGGVKYALSGAATPAFDAVSEMPRRWRDCLAGRGEVDLSAVGVISSCYYLWSRTTLIAELAGFLASRLLSGRVTKLAQAEYPAPFAQQAGTLYRLDDFVIDIRGLVTELASPIREHVLPCAVRADNVVLDGGSLHAFQNDQTRIEANYFVLAAGSGNEALAAAVGMDTPMQRRGLKQVLVHSADPEPIFAHCVTGLSPEPALTITTHAGYHYVGGALASDGATRDDADQIEAAQRALAETLPWIDWSNRRFETMSIDRAEPKQPLHRRPNGAFVVAHENVIVVWPTKLALAPEVGDRVMKALDL